MRGDLKFGINLSIYYPPSEVVRAGLMAEKYGIDTIWVPDHLTDLPPSGDRYDPWVIMTAVGVQTKKLRVSPGVTDVQKVHPAKMAHIIATLDDLIQGRTMVAIGAGEVMNIVPYGILWEQPDTRIKRLKESTDVMRLLWKSSRKSPVNFNGIFYRLENAWLDQHPYQNRSPAVYIGALGAPRALRLVGEIGDGWYPWFNTLETFKKRVGIIESAAKHVGRSLKDIDLAVLLATVITQDEQLRKKAIDGIKSTILVLNDRNVLKSMGYEVKSPSAVDYSYQHVLATEESAAAAESISADIPDEVALKFMLTGPPSACIDTIDRFVKLGATHIIIWDIIGQYLSGSVENGRETLKQVAQSVIPYFRSTS